MKPLRIFMVVAFLVLPLFASQAMAQTITCPSGTYSYHENGGPHATSGWTADAGGGFTITAVAVTGTPAGVTAVVVYTTPPGAQIAEGYVNITVTDHCQTPGGLITLQATTDQPATVTCTFNVTLTNTAPVFSNCPSPSSFDWNAPGGYSFDINATDADAGDLSGAPFSLVTFPVGMNINATTGVITWIPNCADVGGPYPVLVRVTDACGAFDDCSYDVTVTNPATLTCPSNATQSQDGNYATTNWSVNSGDAAINIVSVAVSGGLPPGISVATVLEDAPGYGFPTVTGHVAYTVSDHCLAGGTITLEATDDCIPPNTIQCTFDVTLENNAPSITCPVDVSGPWNVVPMTSGIFSFSDPDGDALTVTVLSAIPAPTNIPVVVGNAVQWTSTCQDVALGAIVVTLQVTEDPGNCILTDECTFTMTATNPATFSCPSNETQNLNGTYTTTTSWSAYSGDAGINIASVVVTGGLPAGISAASVSNVVGLGTPNVTGDVDYTVLDHCLGGGAINLLATDDCATPNTVGCSFDVTLTNTDPVIVCPINATFDYTQDYSGTATATDADGDTYTFSKVSGPGALIVAANGDITWDTDCPDVGGPYDVTVRVTDACGGTDECTFQLTVTNDPPVITLCPNDTVVAAGYLHVSSPFAGYDPESMPLTWAVEDVTPTPTTLPTIVVDHVEWQTALDERGVYTITVRLTDECGLLYDECTYEVAVLFPFEFTSTSVETLGIDSSVVNGDYDDVLALAIRFHIDPTLVSAEELKSIWIRSWNDEHYAVNAIKLWHENDAAAGFQASGSNIDDLVHTIANPGTFDDQEKLQFAGLSVLMSAATQHDFYFTYDMNPDINDDITYNNLWLGMKIGPDDIVLDQGGVGPHGATDTLTYWHRKIRIDVECPAIDAMSFVLAEEIGVDDIVHLGDSICVNATSFAGDIDYTTGVETDFSVFKSAPVWVDMDTTTDKYHFQKCYRIKTETVAHPIDVASGFYYQVLTIADTVGNDCRDSILVNYPIDTQKPIFDSVRVVMFYDGNNDLEISIGDSLQFFAWMLSNALGEVESVWVDMDSVVGVDWQVVLEDTAGEKKWQWKSVVGPGLIDTTADALACWFHAFDNSAMFDAAYFTANTDSMRFLIPYSIDVVPPTGVSVTLLRYVDVDSNNVMNLGDEVLVTVDASTIPDMAHPDSCPVEVLTQEAGFGGPDTCLSDHVNGVYTLIWKLRPDPQGYCKDVGANIAKVKVVIKDDQGNVDTVESNALDRPLDTCIPEAVSGLVATSKPECVVDLDWTDQALDAYMFTVFMAECDQPFDFNDTTGSSFNTTSMNWTTDGTVVLEHGKCYKFVVLTKDDGGNWQLMSEMDTVAAWADCMPPHLCIVLPDSGGTYGAEFAVKALADSESWDVLGGDLYYKKLDIDGLGTPGPWTFCGTMTRPGNALVFVDTVTCIADYTGWVWFAVLSCDSIGNCQDTSEFAADACIRDPLTGELRHGYFMIYWDASVPQVQLMSVNGFGYPQTPCGFDVDPAIMNEVIITVDGATEIDLFEVEVRGPGSGTNYTIIHEDNVTMPYTFEVSVEGWPEGSQNLYISVKDYENDKTGNLQIQLCVPPVPPEHCVYISSPVEWQRIPCTGVSGLNSVPIHASKYGYDQCIGVTFTQAIFEYSNDHGETWNKFDEVLGSSSWSAYWDNTGLVDDGDTVYFRVIAHDEYSLADTSYMVKVFVDCEAPNVQLLMEPIYYTCGNVDIPKINCDPLTFKAKVLDDTVDITGVKVYVKRHSDPDIYPYWWSIAELNEPYYGNIWSYILDEPCSEVDPNDYWDFRIDVVDQANHVMFDYDGDGKFDDATFNTAVTFGAAMTVFVDDEAPQPAFSMVADPAVPIYNVNPSEELGGSDKAYVQAGNDITVEISVLPSEDTCEVEKVEYFLFIDCEWVHVGTSTEPLHYPLTFNPLNDGLIPSLDGWWSGELKAELYDSLGNSNDDIITLYILDVDPTQAVIVEPENGSFVWGDVTLQSKALNAYEICEVCYEYKTEEGDWQPVLNGCTTSSANDWQVVWHTLNTIPDGVYYLRAVATDCDNNVDLDPRTIQVTVSNTLPTITMLEPVPVDSNECPDGPIDTLLFIGGTVELYAQVGEDATPPDVPVERVDFYYKSIFGYPDTWTLIGTDSYAPQVYPLLYAVTWDASGVADGAYHLKATVTEANGRVGDSPYMEVHIDNTPPLTEIIALKYDDFRDETPNNTDITQGTVVEVEAIAFDSLSTAGASECYNSGMEYLQFYVRDCSGEAGAPLDIVWVIDASRSMWEEQEAIGALISQFVAGLGGVDYQLAVVSFDTLSSILYPTWPNYHSVPMDADGYYDTPGAFTGVWTTDEPTFNTMVTSVGIDGGDECGFSALMETNTHYTFRPGASKHFILVTDEDADDFGLEATAIAYMIDNGITVHLIGDPLGGATPAEPHYSAYENMANQTGGMIFNIATSHWGALLAALGAGIAGGGQEVCFMKPATEDGHYFGYWNTSGLPIGEYCLFTVATDDVGNQYTSARVLVRIRDWTPPLVTMAAFHDEYVFGVTADTDIRTVDFKYRPTGGIFTGDEPWTSIGLSSLFATGIWKTEWDPTGLTNGTYEVLAASKDSNNNALPEDSIPRVTIEVTNGVISTANTAYIDSIRFKAFDCNITDAVVKAMTDGTQPTMLTVYNTLEEVVTTELVSMERSTNTSTWFAGTFDATDINSGGTGNFYASLTSDLITYIEMNGIVVAKVFENIGTNGPIYGMDNTVVVSIPDGATDAENGLAILPSDLPISPYWQQQWIPIGNDKGEAAFIFMTSGCDYSFINGKWATITISYDETKVTIPEEGLSVGWWDGSKWVLDQDMYLPTVNTANNTITFYASVLHGVYCVLEIGGFNIAGPTVWPLCDTYSGIMPVFAAHITDRENGIDSSSINVKLSSYRGFPDVRIVENSDDADGFSYNYNTVTGVMEVSWDTTNNPYPLPAGLNAVTVTAMNNVGSFKSATTEFTVDATVPDVVWHPVWVSGEKPAVTFIITDDESGVNKDSIWIDIYDADESDQPYEKDLLLTIYPDGVDEFWTDDTTLYVELTNPCDGQYLHVVIYDGSYCYEYHDYLDWSRRVYAGGVRDCVDNKASAEHLVFPIDRVSPQCSFVTSTYANPVKILVTDPVDTVFHHTYKQGSGVDVNSFKITENGVEVTSFTFNSATNILTYTPTVSGPIEVVVTVMDMVGNEGGIEFNNGDEDAEGPEITWTSLTERPIRISITDAKSGVDWSTLKFYEDGLLICEGLECTDEAVVIDATSGVIKYSQPAGRIHVEIEVKDNAGNPSDADFYTEEEHLAFMDPHNYPNPFDPRAGNSNTTIDLGLSKSAYVTVKIYDFAGEYVATIATNQFVSLEEENLCWDGTSEGGTDVANGTYLCYIKAKDSNGSTKTAVIKITVLKRDK